MFAKRIDKAAPGGKRTPLREALPLATPFVVQMFPTYACNFRCQYCHFSAPPKTRCFVTDTVSMDFELYKKCIDDMTCFPGKIKTLRFVGMGEPLLHGSISDMVFYAKEKNVANTLEILTNGSLLTPERSDALISAGLDRLVVSLQGTSAEKYKEICGVQIEFNSFLDNLGYFYKTKKHTHVYIKIVDCALDSVEDKKVFFDTFGNLCDTIGVEHAVPIFPGANYNDRLIAGEKLISQFGLEVSHTTICPQPFYLMQINSDGKVACCHSIPYPEIFGDCNRESIVEIWRGNKLNAFRRKMLDGRSQVCNICKDCNIMNLRMFPEDDISTDIERLRKCY